MALMPSDLEIWIETDATDSSKGLLKLETIDEYPSLGYEVLYALAAGTDPDYAGMFTVTLQGVKDPQGAAGAMMAPALGEIPYALVDCPACCRQPIEDGAMKLQKGKEYLLVLSEQASSPLGDLHYKLTVTDDEVEIEPLMSIF